MKVSSLRQCLETQALLIGLTAAEWTVPPPTTADPATIKDCTLWHEASASDTCASVASVNGLTEEQLTTYNPILKDSCTFVSGNSYCIEQNWGVPAEPPVSTTEPSTPSSTSGNGISTPTPTQPYMVDNCNEFYFVEKGQGCADIAAENGISLSDFVLWNPSVEDSCAGLWANAYVCVGTTDGPTPSPTPTYPPGNGIATPTPTQPGMVDNCNNFDFVNKGEGCQDVADRNDIPLSQFYEWNPAVGSTCAGLWGEVYVCVGVVGGEPAPTPTTLTTSTVPGNGVPTPTPTQAGMVDNCDEFHFVVSGDSCYDIAEAAGISLEQFYEWNPAVGTDCGGLWAKYYVCTSLI